MDLARLAALGIFGVVAWKLWQRRWSAYGVPQSIPYVGADEPPISSPGLPYEPWREPLDLVLPWTIPDSARPYLPLLRAAEDANGIPRDLLTRVAYQESRFRPDVINGQVISSAGAVGIMQIVPRWHPGVNPLDPGQAIPYAARYLADQARRFGSWAYALAAYNWGPTNVARWINGELSPPLTTRDYVAQILSDVPV